ncbi:hypothetical protein KIW84_066529 [Lathyrus oleraceus]|uniref:KANL2-like probable zinc-finger domain-containing protein n=1 Tax=Pisum sativum TaxID=3888 RepID=A0A9D4WID2_PEA|nr:hypothetical protein KIW84_066529 [Pisum sativum]
MSPPNAPNPTSDPLSTASHLTHRELLCRRLRNTKRLIKNYRRMYWALIEQVRIKHRQYVTETGRSPFEDEPDVVVDNYTNICAFHGCMSKPMPCTSFCFPHILSDPRQVLYKPCTFVIARSADGPVTCQKPIMSSTTPSYCTVHMRKAEMHLAMALQKAGLNISPMGKVGPNFHELVPEFVRQIQAKRRAMRVKECRTVVKKEEDAEKCETEVKKEEDNAEECKTEVEKEDDMAEGK